MTPAPRKPSSFRECFLPEKSSPDGGYPSMDNPSRSYPESIVGRDPLSVTMEAASLAARQVAGARLTPAHAQLLDYAVQKKLVEPLSSFPSISGQQRIRRTLQNMAPALRGEPLTNSQTLGMMSPLPLASPTTIFSNPHRD
jgi:hypothetical protein